jgi:hypothetical protein
VAARARRARPAPAALSRLADVDRQADYWTARRAPPYDLGSMLAIIGNVLAVLLAASLFTATVRLTK